MLTMTRRYIIPLAGACLLVAVCVEAALDAHAAPQPPAEPTGRVALVDDLGTWHHPITTAKPLAQRYFDQGLRLVYAFNHEEAIRSFEEAARIDPNAAMAYWGVAYALGPNINAPMSREQERRALQAIKKAQAVAPAGTPRERAYINVLTLRYSSARNADRKKLDGAYANAMRLLHKKAPDDPDAATLFAEALMDLRPWDYWTPAGEPHPGTMEIIDVLEGVLKKNPEHIGACHYYIHAVEAWQPQRAVACAERLPGLAPGAGHLVHMPSHIYIRIGRYEDAVKRNTHAVSVDRHYFEGRTPAGLYAFGYYPHNIHFLWAVLTMQGKSAEALKAARELIGAVPADVLLKTPEVEFYVPTPFFAMARFGRWQEILQEPPPPPNLSYATGIWHYVRALALTATGQLNQALEEQQAVERIAKAMPSNRIVGLNPAADLLQIASHVAAGQVAAKRGQSEEAIRQFEDAVRMQDALRYYEPPDWYYPVRESLGRALLTAGRAREAAEVFRQDLKRTPNNPWSLHGLMESLRAQEAEAKTEHAELEEQFKKAWSQADLEFQPSKFEAFLAS